MSIYDNAGVVLIPSGYKAGTTDNLYSVLPANGNGDFNATRGSTATRINKDGLIESVATNVPRLDYPLIDGVVQDCPALLLEPSRTNVITNSNQFNANANVSLNVDNSISPNGSLNAVKMTGNSGTSLKLVDTNGASFGTYIFSVFAKKDTHSIIQLGGGGISGHANFNLETGEHSTGGSMEIYGNGWYRCSVQFLSGTPTSHYISFSDSLIANRLSTSVSTGSFFVFGMQSEQGSYPTSYIPTSGSTATRSADVCNGSGTSAEFNDSEGVLFAEISALADDLTFRTIAISNGGTGQNIGLGFRTSSNVVYTFLKSDINSSTNVTVSNIAQYNKVAVKYKSGDFAMWINGIEVYTSSTTFILSGLNELSFDNGGGTADFYGKTKQLMTFKTALNDSELETLTSWDSFNAMATGQLYTIE
jgi:hypothetical protein